MKIIDYITGREIYTNTPKKTVRDILRYHNSTFVDDRDNIHYPEYAIAEELGDVIIIRRQHKL